MRRNSAPSRKCPKAVQHQTWDLCNREVVGLGGLEPPTSPLSGARSSHLSYRPAKQQQILARAGFLRIHEMATQVTWAEALDLFSSPGISAVRILARFQIGATIPTFV